MNVQEEILAMTSMDTPEEQIYALITIVQRISDRVDELEKGQRVLRKNLRGDEA